MMLYQCDRCKYHNKYGYRTCDAFPKGIPPEIRSYPQMDSDKNCLRQLGYIPIKHNKVIEGQVGSFIFTPKTQS